MQYRRSHASGLSGLLVLALLVTGSGCSWFGNKTENKPKKDKPKPTKLVKIDSEVKINRLWRANVGQGKDYTLFALKPGTVRFQIGRRVHIDV